MNITFSVTTEQRDKFYDEFSKYNEEASRDGYPSFSQSKFFLNIFEFWLGNKKSDKK